MFTTIDVTYRVVTPMFCAGADAKRPELRAASFKGVLRYWWRALAWSRFDGNLEDIKRQEDELFGSAVVGRSRVAMHLARVRAGARKAPASDPQPFSYGDVLTVGGTGRTVGHGARYLGYGVMEAFESRKRKKKAGQLTRACLRAPFDFTVRMRGRDLNSDQLASLRDALVALGTLGGMGAKSRKGYGSLVIRSLQVNGDPSTCPRSLDDLRTTVAAFRPKDGAAGLPEFTAFSKRTRHVLLTSKKREPLELLDLVGRELVRFRSWGRNGKIFGDIEAERNFRPDHDMMKGRPPRRQSGPRSGPRPVSGLRRTEGAHPERIAFGLPHNYGRSPNQQVGPWDRNLDRRASPLFIHIHECGGTPVAVLSFLPARFLPQGKMGGGPYISVRGSRVRQRPEIDAQHPEKGLYRPVDDFLDRLLDRSKREERFSDAIPIPAGTRGSARP